MLFQSTRGGGCKLDFEGAVLGGYAGDGGLYVPEYIPSVTLETLRAWRELSFQDLAVEVLGLFVGTCIPKDDLQSIVVRSFAAYTHESVVPVVRAGSGLYVAELFHGPTLAFKDFGLQVTCQMLDFFAARSKRQITLVVSTTGDTGPAAIHGACGSKSLRVVVTYPKGQISVR